MANVPGAQSGGTVLTIQYLEDSPELDALTAEEVRGRLRAALACLPLDGVIVGWRLPQPLQLACAEEAARAGARLYRWHPLLTGDATFPPQAEWRAVGPDGAPVPGFLGRPEFTFLCPNRAGAREAVLAHLQRAIRGGGYQGIFLDRMRYPSPAADPGRLLACFCEDCRAAAAEEGLDLEVVRAAMRGLPSRELVRALLDPRAPAPEALRAFLGFRGRSVTRLVSAAAELARDEGLAVGLDCFSPALTYMVGQDLASLDRCGDWTKAMTYGHTLGPAGLPFELLQLAGQTGLGEAEGLAWVSAAAQVPLPSTPHALEEDGLAPGALAGEVRRARAAGVRILLAGIELVQVPGVTRLSGPQVARDLRALAEAGADGLALSWDLLHMPGEWLELVAREWKR